MTKTVNMTTLFQPGKYQPFRKGQVWSHGYPWIKRQPGQKDFLIIKEDADLKHLELYLSGKHEKYVADEYNTFTTGRDGNGSPMIGLYWNDERMDMMKRGIIVIQNDVLVEGVLFLVDSFLKEDTTPSWQAVQPQAAPAAKPMGTLGEQVMGAYGHPALRKKEG